MLSALSMSCDRLSVQHARIDSTPSCPADRVNGRPTGTLLTFGPRPQYLVAMSNLRAIGAYAPAPPEAGYDYPEKYVAFLDILGFSDLVERADQDPGLRKGLAEVLHILQTTCGSNPVTGTRVTQFSDSLVITAHRTEQGLCSIVHRCEWLTINLIQYAVLLRGGVAVGRVSHKAHILWHGNQPRISVRENRRSAADRLGGRGGGRPQQ
jgi:hypothetical protein